MRYCAKTKGFSTVEVLTVIAILAILASILLGVGRRLQAQAEEKLARSMVDILVSALEQYYDYHGAFPFEADINYSQVDLESPNGGLDGVNDGVNGTVVGLGVNLPEYCSGEALYYYLSRTPPSRQIIETLTDRMISSKDSAGVALQIEIPTGTVPPVDLIRFIDPWGNSIRYTYMSGNTFPLIVCAGPDGEWNTGDEIDSR